MEQKKTLWIVAAAGVFLLVVVGAALILYSPSVQQSSEMLAGFDPNSGWISSTKNSATPVPGSELSFNSEETSQDEKNSGLTPSPFASQNQNIAEVASVKDENGLNPQSSSPIHANKLTVISDNTTLYSSETTTIDLNSLKSSNSSVASNSSSSNIVAKNEFSEKELKSVSQSENVRASENAPKYEDYYAPAPMAKAKTSVKSVEPKKSVAKAESPKSSAKAQVAKTSQPVTKAATAKKVAAAAKKPSDSFWVQAAAYTSKRNADEARTTLESNKIPSEVFTFTDSNGKTFYRVRVGPYITKSEAEYWQTRIGMIDKFASAKSVIVNTAVN